MIPHGKETNWGSKSSNFATNVVNRMFEPNHFNPSEFHQTIWVIKAVMNMSTKACNFR